MVLPRLNRISQFGPRKAKGGIMKNQDAAGERDGDDEKTQEESQPTMEQPKGCHGSFVCRHILEFVLPEEGKCSADSRKKGVIGLRGIDLRKVGLVLVV